MGQLSQFAPFLLMFVVIYFFMIRPQQKRAKAEKEFESSLKVGDKIIDIAGKTIKIITWVIQIISFLKQFIKF